MQCLCIAYALPIDCLLIVFWVLSECKCMRGAVLILVLMLEALLFWEVLALDHTDGTLPASLPISQAHWST